MRCYIKEHYYMAMSGELPHNKLYQKEIWNFTGRIKYQGDEDGDIVVCFEVTMSNKDDPQWYSDYWFDFDDSTDAVIYDCNNKE